MRATIFIPDCHIYLPYWLLFCFSFFFFLQCNIKQKNTFKNILAVFSHLGELKDKFCQCLSSATQFQAFFSTKQTFFDDLTPYDCASPIHRDICQILRFKKKKKSFFPHAINLPNKWHHHLSPTPFHIFAPRMNVYTVQYPWNLQSLNSPMPTSVHFFNGLFDFLFAGWHYAKLASVSTPACYTQD